MTSALTACAALTGFGILTNALPNLTLKIIVKWRQAPLCTFIEETTMQTTEQRMSATQIAQAKHIWAEYQTRHDLTELKGQAAGIDPETGAVWLGESAIDIADQRNAQGLSTPLFLVRVGSPAYLRKKGRQ